jgi:hypothetical protein
MERVQKFPCLVKRDGTYYVRMRVPKDLAHALKKKELKRGLKTKDYGEARRRYQSAYGELLRQVTQARERLKPVIDNAMCSLTDEALEETARSGARRRAARSHSGFA